MIRYKFPERAGALHEFLERINDLASICYFNYQYTGEREGHALIGLEFSSEDGQTMLDRTETDEVLSKHYHRLTTRLPGGCLRRGMVANINDA